MDGKTLGHIMGEHDAVCLNDTAKINDQGKVFMEKCGTTFPVATHGLWCPNCGNTDPQKIKIEIGWVGGKKVPKSFMVINPTRWDMDAAKIYNLQNTALNSK